MPYKNDFHLNEYQPTHNILALITPIIVFAFLGYVISFTLFNAGITVAFLITVILEVIVIISSDSKTLYHEWKKRDFIGYDVVWENPSDPRCASQNRIEPRNRRDTGKSLGGNYSLYVRLGGWSFGDGWFGKRARIGQKVDGTPYPTWGDFYTIKLGKRAGTIIVSDGTDSMTFEIATFLYCLETFGQICLSYILSNVCKEILSNSASYKSLQADLSELQKQSKDLQSSKNELVASYEKLQTINRKLCEALVDTGNIVEYTYDSMRKSTRLKDHREGRKVLDDLVASWIDSGLKNRYITLTAAHTPTPHATTSQPARSGTGMID